MTFEKTPLAYCLCAAFLSFALGFLAMADVMMADAVMGRDGMAILPTWLVLPLAMTGLVVSLVSAFAFAILRYSRPAR